MSFEQITFEQIVTIASLVLSLLTVTASIVISVFNHKSAVSIKLHEERISAYSKFLATSLEFYEHLSHRASYNETLYKELLLSSQTAMLLCGDSVEKHLVQLTSLIPSENIDLFCKTISSATTAMKFEIKECNTKNLFA